MIILKCLTISLEFASSKSFLLLDLSESFVNTMLDDALIMSLKYSKRRLLKDNIICQNRHYYNYIFDVVFFMYTTGEAAARILS